MTDSAAAGSLTALGDRFSSWLSGWHAVFIGLVVVVAVAVQFQEGLSGAQRLSAVGILAVMAAWYVLTGWRQLGTENTLWGTLYIVGAWLLFLALVAVTDNGQVYFLLFALLPQIWMYLAARQAVIMTAVGSIAVGAVQISTAGWTSESMRGTLPWIALQIAVALMLGLFITGIFTEAERRAALIDELERTRTELASTEHARGVLAERERLAHEIHDTLAQGFTSVLTLAQAVEVTLDRDPTVARQRLRLLEEAARENLAEARALVGGLRPVNLQEHSLVDAIRRVADRCARADGISVDVNVEGAPRSLTLDEDVIVLRAAQEALANVRRHANATSVKLTLTYPGDRGIVLTVRDDGHGFDAAQPAPGYGIAGMAARAAQVGGAATVISEHGCGTMVTVALPGLDDRSTLTP